MIPEMNIIAEEKGNPMNGQIPPEPPDDTRLVVTESNDEGDIYIVYRNDELAILHGNPEKHWFYGDDKAIHPRKYPIAWDDLWLQTVESGVELNTVGAPFPGKTVEPEDLEGGKRYRVIFEGTYNSDYARFDRGRGGWINDHELTYASRIEEIGGEQ